MLESGGQQHHHHHHLHHYHHEGKALAEIEGELEIEQNKVNTRQRQKNQVKFGEIFFIPLSFERNHMQSQ